MIFVTLGSQKFQFNRLLEEIDRLVKEKKIKSDIFIQIGYSTYVPRNCKFKKFLNKSEYTELIANSEIVITHGGTGSIINSLKKGKKVIGIPRDFKYGEHVDNHQYEIIKQFMEMNLIYGLLDIKNLERAINEILDIDFRKYTSNTANIINIIEDYIESIKV